MFDPRSDHQPAHGRAAAEIPAAERVLKPSGIPGLRLVGSALFTLVWNGVISIVGHDLVWRPLRTGSAPPWSALFFAPLVAIGAGMAGYTVYNLIALWNPRPHPTLPPRSSLGATDAVLIDGAERLSWLGWRRLCWRVRLAGTFIVTTHVPPRRLSLFDRTLPILLHTRVTLALLEDLVAELAPAASDERGRLSELFHKHDGNLREVMRALYDDASG